MYIFNSLVLKIASRCNLNCSYCFMYNLGDDSYKLQPKYMNDDTIEAIVEKSYTYIIKNKLKTFNFLFHGGEPLLTKKKEFIRIITKLKELEIRIYGLDVTFSIQSNGLLIDKEWCKIINDYNIEIGVSIDGTKESNDKYRVDHKGNGSYDRVKKGLKKIKKHTGQSGIICVLDIDEKPENLYQSFKDLNVNYVNLLLKDYTYENFPYEKDENYKFPFANFLIELFEIWLLDDAKIKIPFFSGFISLIVGLSENSEVDSIELKSLIIESDGGIEPIDSLKACGNNFTKLNLNVFKNEIEDIHFSQLGDLYFNKNKVCKQCQKCSIYDICLGGRLVHRYKKTNGFDNPSIYCEDLIKFIGHVQNKLLKIFPDLDTSSIEPIDYEAVIKNNIKN